MPYIPAADRPRVASEGATNAGELNYELTLTIRGHMHSCAPLRYQHVNDVVGALDVVRHGLTQSLYIPGEGLERELFAVCRSYYLRGHRYADIQGALECCKLEFYRRVAVPYEDRKIKLNGDVY